MLKNKEILLLDNNEEITSALKKLQRKNAFKLLLADSETCYAEIFKSYQPEIVIISAENSFGQTPLDALKEIEKLGFNCKIIVLVTEPDFNQAMLWINKGIFRVIKSSETEETLVAILKQAICASPNTTIKESSVIYSNSIALNRDFKNIYLAFESLHASLDINDFITKLRKLVKNHFFGSFIDLKLANWFSAPKLFVESTSSAKNNKSKLDRKFYKQFIQPLVLNEQKLGEILIYFDKQKVNKAIDIPMLELLAQSASLALLNINRYQRAIKLASRDALTGLYNRRIFNESLKREFAVAERHNSPLSLIILDLDFFKSINDTYGHQAGDSLLKHISAIIQSTVRETDVAARIGGEEFAIIMPRTLVSQASILARRIKNSLDASKLPSPLTHVKQTVSQGIADIGHFLVKTSEDLVYWADKALYQAKHQGRDTIVAANNISLNKSDEDKDYVIQ